MSNPISRRPISRRQFIGTTGALSIAPLAAFAQTKDSPASSANAGKVQVEKDVVFGKGGTAELRCDIYRPPAEKQKRMALIHYHGGGFTRGSKNGLGPKISPFVARGYVAIAAQYRLTGVAKWPSQLEDVKTCIRWTRANADRLGIDPAHIAVVGYSAGGLLALMAAGTQNRPEFEGNGGNAGVSTAVASAFGFYPALTVRRRADGTEHPLMPAGSDEAAYATANVYNYVKSFPATALFHGVADTTIPLASSQRFFASLQEAKVPAELHAYAGVPHEFDTHPEFADEVSRTTDFFLERYVLHPRTYPPFGFGRRRGA